MQNCHLKIARDWQDSFRLDSDLNACWLGRRTKNGMKAFRPLLTFGLIMVMTFMLQSVPLSLTLYGPDLSHCPLAESLLIQRARKGPYALCLHATHLQQWHETCIDVSWLKPAAHRETASVSCWCWNIRADPSLSILQIHYGHLRGLTWRNGNVSAGKLHPAKVSPRKSFKFHWRWVNIQWLLSVWLHDEVSVRQFEKKPRPSLCHHCIYAQMPHFNNLREGWSKISTLECMNTTFQSWGTVQNQVWQCCWKSHVMNRSNTMYPLCLSPLSYRHLIWANGTIC